MQILNNQTWAFVKLTNSIHHPVEVALTWKCEHVHDAKSRQDKGLSTENKNNFSLHLKAISICISQAAFPCTMVQTVSPPSEAAPTETILLKKKVC